MQIEYIKVSALKPYENNPRKNDSSVGKVAESSTWDEDLLKLEIGNIPDIDMSRFGFNFDIETPEAKADDYEVKLPEKPRSRPGEAWILGAHRLMCGDATKEDDVMEIDPKYVDVIIDRWEKFTGNKAVKLEG